MINYSSSIALKEYRTRCLTMVVPVQKIINNDWWCAVLTSGSLEAAPPNISALLHYYFFKFFVVMQMNPSVIRQWLRGGEIDQLEQVVLEGQGHKLIGEYSPDPKVRNFLKIVPNYMVSCLQASCMLWQFLNNSNPECVEERIEKYEVFSFDFFHFPLIRKSRS